MGRHWCGGWAGNQGWRQITVKRGPGVAAGVYSGARHEAVPPGWQQQLVVVAGMAQPAAAQKAVEFHNGRFRLINYASDVVRCR